jgi:hypothetical protein
MLCDASGLREITIEADQVGPKSWLQHGVARTFNTTDIGQLHY